jgi:probable rRNA maturation factor
MDSTTHLLDLKLADGQEKQASIDVSVSISNFDHLPSSERVIELVQRVLEGESAPFESIGIILADHETVLELNRTWLEHDFHTDVLSFLIEDDPRHLEGEVYVDVETAEERHQEFESTVQEEIERYIVHGLLHLVGYDDATEAERSAMQQLENRYATL